MKEYIKIIREWIKLAKPSKLWTFLAFFTVVLTQVCLLIAPIFAARAVIIQDEKFLCNIEHCDGCNALSKSCIIASKIPGASCAAEKIVKPEITPDYILELFDIGYVLYNNDRDMLINSEINSYHMDKIRESLKDKPELLAEYQQICTDKINYIEAEKQMGYL